MTSPAGSLSSAWPAGRMTSRANRCAVSHAARSGLGEVRIQIDCKHRHVTSSSALPTRSEVRSVVQRAQRVSEGFKSGQKTNDSFGSLGSFPPASVWTGVSDDGHGCAEFDAESLRQIKM